MCLSMCVCPYICMRAPAMYKHRHIWAHLGINLRHDVSVHHHINISYPWLQTTDCILLGRGALRGIIDVSV